MMAQMKVHGIADKVMGLPRASQSFLPNMEDAVF